MNIKLQVFYVLFPLLLKNITFIQYLAINNENYDESHGLPYWSTQLVSQCGLHYSFMAQGIVGAGLPK